MINVTMFSFWFLDFKKKKKKSAAADGQQHASDSVSWDSTLVNNSEPVEKFYKEAER